MESKEVEGVAKILTQMKDATAELENALKNKNSKKIDSLKRRILELRMQVDKQI